MSKQARGGSHRPERFEVSSSVERFFTPSPLYAAIPPSSRFSALEELKGGAAEGLPQVVADMRHRRCLEIAM